MKIFGYIINSMLILGIVVYFVIIGIQSREPVMISVDLDTKKIKSSDLIASLDEPEEKEEVKEELDSEEDTEEVIEEEVVEEEVIEEVEEVSTPVSTPKPVTDVLETQVGSLSGYGPDCKGCSGFLFNGMDVRDGNIYYQDSTYGKVRILAGDRSYPEGTIVRVKNSKLPLFYGIVLDRGSVGFDGTHLFDLLYASEKEASFYGVSYNTTFEILRYGY